MLSAKRGQLLLSIMGNMWFGGIFDAVCKLFAHAFFHLLESRAAGPVSTQYEIPNSVLVEMLTQNLLSSKEHFLTPHKNRANIVFGTEKMIFGICTL